LTTDQLIKGLKRGKRKAFNHLYATYASLFYTMCLRYAKSSQEAEDFTQEAFVRIFEKIDQFDDRGSFEGWMKRIVVTTCLNGIRGKQLLNEPLHDEDDDDSFGMVEDASIFSELAAEEILQCVEELPEGYRVVFNLVVLESYSHKEVAELLNISESASRSQLSKAKNKLKALVVTRNAVLYEQTGS
jgi:RNA polymerase sigma-70 factor (ECF subfamily)